MTQSNESKWKNLRNFIDGYLQEGASYRAGSIYEASPTTQDSYKNYIYNHIIADIGDLQLDQLTQKHLQDYYERLKVGGRLVRQNVFGEGVSDRMVRGCHLP